MKQLSKLQALVETASSEGREPIDKFFNKLEDEVEAAFECVKKIKLTLQSQVLTDLVKSNGHQASESQMAKQSAKAADEAIRKLEEEINDLHKALAMNHESVDD